MSALLHANTAVVESLYGGPWEGIPSVIFGGFISKVIILDINAEKRVFRPDHRDVWKEPQVKRGRHYPGILD